MSDIAIKVENLGKSYVIGHNSKEAERYIALRDVVTRNARNLLRSTRSMVKGDPIVQGDETEEFWALKEIGFEIRHGDKVGIIGRNGAGKSTLLKILSRITEPTTGRVTINGRLASLLEVGTGFHPELTGRENIFLNGAILGMSRREIQRKFDGIVDFAEVEKFLDTPVKRYSSGMYVRLAFAIASFLEPEILVVDEVLAVGDAQFQKKCLGKMEEAGRDGRTVIFVSHSMAMISNLCKTGIVLNSGRIDCHGPVSQAVVRYYQTLNRTGRATERGFSSDVAELLGCELVGSSKFNEASIFDPITIRMHYRILRAIDGKCVPNLHFFSADGSCAFVSNADAIREIPPGHYVADCQIPGGLLNEGAYFVGAAITTYPPNGTYHVEFFDRNALTFNVTDPMDERSNRYNYVGPIPGLLRPKLNWSVRNYSP